MLQVAEEGARKRIASWLDGKYRCVNFADALGTEHGLVRNASLTLIKEGDEVTLDFTGTSPENLSPYHAHVQAVVGHVANYVYSYVFYDLPISSATFAPFTFVIPKGTVLNPDDRAATSLLGDGLHGRDERVRERVREDDVRLARSTTAWRRRRRNAGNAMVIAGHDAVGPAVRRHGRLLDQHRGHGRPPGVGRHERVRVPVVPVRPRARRRADGERVPAADPALPALDGLAAARASTAAASARCSCGSPTRRPMVLLMAIADNSKLQTPQPLFGGYAPCTVPGIGIRAPGLMDAPEGGRRHRPRLPHDHRAALDRRPVGGRVHGPLDPALRRGRRDGLLRSRAGGAGYGDPLEADPEDVARDFAGGLISAWTMSEIYKVAYDEVDQRRAGRAETERLRRGRAEARRARATATGRRSTPPGRSCRRPRTCSSGSAPGRRASPTAPVMRM